ncbi:MAG TPA: FAD-binding oxidoreductase [Burkholderiaceae bacterium]|nr:FAD-binding oxidoreductase [Burkholderiaceae bacterium]
MAHYDLVILGAGVVGCSIAFHAAKLGAGRVLLLDRGGIAEGTTSQSSGIIRTHYSVPENVELAQRSYAAFRDFAAYVGEPQASSGFTRCGYLVVAAGDAHGAAVRAALAQQRGFGLDAREIDAAAARELLPLLRTDGLAVFGYEPDAGYADAHLVATGFAAAARRLGVEVRTGVAAAALRCHRQRVTGVTTSRGDPIDAGVVVCALNVWTPPLLEPLGIRAPLQAERHEVVALEAPQPYLPSYPVLKDMASASMLYARCYGRRQLLVSRGLPGLVTDPDEGQAPVPLDLVAELGEQVAQRLDGFDEAALASSWTGLYDVTPDWNPVLGPVEGWAGLQVAFGFSGHGFKLSPAVGRLLAQSALGLEPDLSLAPYALERFDRGRPLVGRYGPGAVS